MTYFLGASLSCLSPNLSIFLPTINFSRSGSLPGLEAHGSPKFAQIWQQLAYAREYLALTQDNENNVVRELDAQGP